MLFRALRGFVYKRYSDTFFYLFSEKGKDKLYDKSTLLHIRWQKFVYQVLASQGESESRRRCYRRVRMLYVQRLIVT